MKVEKVISQKKVEWALEVMETLRKRAIEVREDWSKRDAMIRAIIDELPKILRAFLYLVKDEYRRVVYETIKELAESLY